MKVILTEKQMKAIAAKSLVSELAQSFDDWAEANKEQLGSLANSFDEFTNGFKLFGGLKNFTQTQNTTATYNNASKATDGIKMSDQGIQMLKQSEGVRLNKYYATEYERANGIATIGYGHVIKANDPDWLKNANSITESQAEQILRSDLSAFENSVAVLFDKHIQGGRAAAYSYPQALVDVLISIAYNAGPGGLEKSPIFTALQRVRFDTSTNTVNQQDLTQAIPYIKNSCVTQGGKELAGLTNRRNREYAYVVNSMSA